MTKAVCLLSGGMDSAVAFALALQENDEVGAVSALYGQKHARELEHAIKIVSHYRGLGASNIGHQVVELPQIFGGAGSTLIDPELKQPHMTYKEIAESEGPSPTVVPFRNANLLSIATTIAIREGATLVYAGMHAEDARNWAYPSL